MYPGSPIDLVVLALFFAFLVINYIIDKGNMDVDPIVRSFNRFKINLLGFAIILIILLFSLPYMPVSNRPQSGQEPLAINDLLQIIQATE